MRSAIAAILALYLAGCVGQTVADEGAYRAGYSDGCESARSAAGVPARRNEALFSASADYRKGWATARATCGTR